MVTGNVPPDPQFPLYSQVQQADAEAAERAQKAAQELANRQLAEQRRRDQERQEALAAEARRRAEQTHQRW